MRKENKIYTIGQISKMSGLEIRDIRQFMKWCSEGSQTYGKRYDLLQKQRAAVEAEFERMKKNLAMICFKCWYYEQAMKDGNEERLKKMLPDKLPGEIQVMYNYAHDLCAQNPADSIPGRTPAAKLLMVV